MSEKPAAKRENMLLNLLLNIVIPTTILIKFSSEEYLGPQLGIVVALAFPICYGISDYFRAGKLNFFSALGVFSVTLTGGMSLLEIDPKYIAIKEATVPLIFGLATLISAKTKYPVVRIFLYNENIMATETIRQALQEQDNEKEFDQLLINASWMLAGSFLLSSVLNYILARVILVSPPGTEAFNSELGKMTALSFPVIALPCMIVMMFTLFYLFRNITRLTQLELDDIIQQPEK